MSTALLDALRRADYPLQSLAPEDSARVEQIAVACADLFQRGSSRVEGATANWRCIIKDVIL